MATSWASWHILWIAGVGTMVSGLVGVAVQSRSSTPPLEPGDARH